MSPQLSRNPAGTFRPYAEATGSQSVANNSFVVADLTTSVYDNGATTTGAAMVDLAANTITLRRTGIWLISGYASWAANGSGFRRVTINHSVSGNVTGNINTTFGGFFGAFHGTEAMIYATTASTTVDLRVYQSSGGGLNCDTKLRATWLGAYS